MRHEEVAVFAARAEAHLAGDLTVCAGSHEPHNLHLSRSGQTPFPSGLPSAGAEVRRIATTAIGPFNRKGDYLIETVNMGPSNNRFNFALPNDPAHNRTTAFTVVFFAPALLTGCSGVGAPSFELFGAFFPAWLFCGIFGVVAAAAARGFFLGTGISDLLPYQLFVCAAIGVIAACGAWLFWFGWG